MSRTAVSKHSLPSSHSKPDSTRLVPLDATSVIENIKQTALPKEVSFGLYFSYQR